MGNTTTGNEKFLETPEKKFRSLTSSPSANV
jgi:hypothetical protein